MVTSSTVPKSTTMKTARGGQTMVIPTAPVRDTGNDGAKAPRKMGGSNDNLSHSITDGNKVPAK